MDLLTITPTLKWSDTIKVLHIEPTDLCQAACPLCARETDVNFNKSTQHHLSMMDLIEILGVDRIAELDKMFMCGNYGDPAAGKHTLNIYRGFRTFNPEITLGMNTNGAIHTAMWWQELANILNKPRDYVVFSIDGLQDTNHIYRKNVVWSKLIENAQEFINAGGNAHWDMLVYEHNEHQVDLCEQLARDMGFKWFRAKVSKRPSNIHWLNPPRNWQSPLVEQGNIDCFIKKESSIYIDAQRKVYPCCWLGYTDNTIDKFDSVQGSWNTVNCNTVCKETCSSNNNSTSFTNQWQRNVELC